MQERRALEEQLFLTIDTLTEEAQRLFKNIGVLHNVDRSQNKLDSGEVEKEVHVLMQQADGL